MMKRTVIGLMALLWFAALLMAVLSGCSTISVDMTKPDGTHITAARSGLFMESKEITGEFEGLKIGATGSGSDIEAMKAVTEAAVTAGIKAVKK